MSIDYATADATATAGLDYTATSGTLTWADGDGGPKTFTVSIPDDALVEGPERVALTLSAPTRYAIPGSPDAVVLNIADREEGRLQFSAPTYRTAEDGGTAVVTVSRTNGTDR